MPKPPLPPELDALLARANPAVIASIAARGAPSCVATWYLWEGGRVLVNMDESRRRLEHLHREPRVALTVLDGDDWYRHVSLRGRVVSLEEDRGLVDIDRIAQHYTGRPYRTRERKRYSAWVEVDRWHAWYPHSR